LNGNIQIINTATPFLRRVASELPRETRKAIKSSGWWLQQDLKRGIAAGAPGGQQYERFSQLPSRLRTRKRKRKRVWGERNTRKKPLGRLGAAVRYKFYSDSIRAVVGWISPGAKRLGTLQEQGKNTTVTPRMRKMFAAAGIPLGRKAEIRIPRRPTIEPEYRAKAPEIPRYVETKILEYIRRAEH
jgi:hypothetical protein